jgi:membrane protein required for colicin V production
MSLLDLSLLAIIGVSALFGVMRGFVGVLASLAAWLLAGWAAFHFGAETARWMSSDGPPTATELLGGYALSFVAVMLFVGIVGWVVRQFIKTVGLSGLDRALGLVLGLVRGAVVACVLLVLVGFTPLPREPEWQASPVIPVLLPGARWLSTWLPEWTVQELDFGNGAPAGDNARLPSLPRPLDDSGAAQDSVSPSASPQSKPE